MSDFPATYTEKKKRAIEKAVASLEASSAEKQPIGPKDSNESMWVTQKKSPLGEEVLKKGSGYKQYPSYFKNNKEYLIFSISEV